MNKHNPSCSLSPMTAIEGEVALLVTPFCQIQREDIFACVGREDRDKSRNLLFHQLMVEHAVAILGMVESWSPPLTLRVHGSGEETEDSKFKGVATKLLSGFIVESIALGGTLLDQFWLVVGECHPKLVWNSRSWSFSYRALNLTSA
jgi:hypothetical protein